MTLSQTLYFSILSPIIAVAVVLSGVHAKDVAGLTVITLMPRKKVEDTSQQVKIHADAHPHIEKAKITAGGDQSSHTDGRSLRALNEHKKDAAKFVSGFGDAWRNWWRSHAPMLLASLL